MQNLQGEKLHGETITLKHPQQAVADEILMRLGGVRGADARRQTEIDCWGCPPDFLPPPLPWQGWIANVKK